MDKKNTPKLKPEHRAVLNALEVANTSYQRAVTVGEVVKALSLCRKDSRLLNGSYASDANTAVGKILSQLLTRKIIFSPGRNSSKRYYGTEKALPPDSRSLPPLISRRQRVLQLVRETALNLKRAVRTGDVLEYAALNPEEFDISPELITRDILTLKATGDLLLVGSTFRRDSEGKNYYLPADFNPAEFVVKGPLTWMEEVASSFTELWTERTRKANESNRLPRPISTTEIRSHMMALPHQHPNLRKPVYLIGALIQLTETKTPFLRKIRRRGKLALLWAPYDVPDDRLDLGDIYVNDAERIGEAVARAVGLLGRPVTVKDITAEIKLDPTLRPAGTGSLASAIHEAARIHGQRYRKGEHVCYSRNLVRVFNVGAIDNRTYYCHSKEGLEDAKFFVQFEQTKRRWSACGAVEQLTALTGCGYPSIALGRALMVQSDAKRAKLNIERLLNTKCGSTETRGQAENFLVQVLEVYGQIQLWLKDNHRLVAEYPFTISSMPPTWTGAELHAFLKPFYPVAQSTIDPNKVVRSMFRHIRRIPNPNFRSRFSRNPDEAPNHLFDRTDALIYAAQKWGGYEAYFQASLAAFNLGLLRDARFVLPLLNMRKFDDRLAGVACLAFIQTEIAMERLRAAAVQDNSSIVREAALWACGFIEGKLAKDLFIGQQERDTDPRLRDFCRTAQQFDARDWWDYGGDNAIRQCVS
jgi:hypothetical protein